MKKILFLAIIIFSASSYATEPTIKRSEDVFQKWLSWQKIFEPCITADASKNVDDNFNLMFRQTYENNLLLLKDMQPFLNNLTHGQINNRGHLFKQTLDETFKNNIIALHSLFDIDQYQLALFLNELGLTSKATKQSSDNDVNRYVALSALLFPFEGGDRFLFSAANKLFRYCFAPETFPTFHKWLMDKSHQPIAKFYYSLMWHTLAGNGWKNWSAQCLDNLKKDAEAGKEIVYIAGGSDIYQLIKHGIYNIRIIDPQLPSQPKYYTNDWEWIVRGATADGGVGDCIVFTFDDKKVIMQRRQCVSTGKIFQVRLANDNVITLEKSATIWDLFEPEGKLLGTYILERRLCNQNDFVINDKQSLLVSFNELYYVCLPDMLGGWGIDVGQFRENMTIHVKQLHEPINKGLAINMGVASLINMSDFKFIALGTCIN